MMLKANIKVLLIAFFINIIFYTHSFSVDYNSIDRLTTYSTILGRGLGCGFDLKDEIAKVGIWIEKEFTSESSIYMKIFMVSLEKNAKDQSLGNTPDTCSSLKRSISNIPLP